MSELRDFDRNLPMALLRAREAVMARFRPILRAHNITEQQWRVIRALYNEREGLEVTALSERTLILMPSLTRILKTLEAEGLVARLKVAGDNRRSLTRLAGKGEALYTCIAPLSEAEYEKLEAEIGEENLNQLYHILKQIG